MLCDDHRVGTLALGTSLALAQQQVGVGSAIRVIATGRSHGMIDHKLRKKKPIDRNTVGIAVWPRRFFVFRLSQKGHCIFYYFLLMEVRISHSIGAMVATVCHGATSIGFYSSAGRN